MIYLSSDEEILNNSIPKIKDLVESKWLQFPDLGLLIITPSQWLRVSNMKMENRMEFVELSSIRRLQPQRGKILDFFSKLEVFWAGGKTQLLQKLYPLIPAQFNRYFEPFLGGGALFFYLIYKQLILTLYLQMMETQYPDMQNFVNYVIIFIFKLIIN
jgi:DNA adenine methylase